MTRTDAEALIDEVIPQDAPSMVSPRTIATLLDVSLTTVGVMVSDGRLPAPVRLSRKTLRYPRNETRLALLRLLTGGAA